MEAINNATGSTLSATGIIMGALATLGAFFWNLVLEALDLVLGVIEFLVNPFINFANFVVNVLNDPVGSFIQLFSNMGDTVLGILQKIVFAMDFVFGTNMADTIQEWRDGLSEQVDRVLEKYSNGEYEEVVSRLDLSTKGLGLSKIDYADAWNAGYSFGEGIDESIENFDLSFLFGITDIPSADDYASALAAGGLEAGLTISPGIPGQSRTSWTLHRKN